jgi:hypothetical protein
MAWAFYMRVVTVRTATATVESLCFSPTPVTCLLRKIVGIPGKGAYLRVTQIKIKLCPYCNRLCFSFE